VNDFLKVAIQPVLGLFIPVELRMTTLQFRQQSDNISRDPQSIVLGLS
jgi:hypothetical protein